MKFLSEKQQKQSGIYKIVNTHTNRFYIGQAKNFKNRWRDHKHALKKNRHGNDFLQNDYNKCGWELGNDDFIEFDILELMENSTKSERNQKEEFWINQFYDNQNFCYNFSKKVNGEDRSCRSLTPEETRLKCSESMKSSWLRKTLEEKEEIAKKISKAHMGKKQSSEQKEKNRLGHIGLPVWNKGLKIPQMSGENHPNFGKSPTEETKLKISNSKKGQKAWNKGLKMPQMSGKNHPNFGKTMLEETKIKLLEANKGKIPWNKGLTGELNPLFGKPLAEETKQKISLAKKGKPTGQTPWNKGIGEETHPLFGKGISDETKEKMAAARRGKPLPEKTKTKISEANSGENHHLFGGHHSEETKQKISETKRAQKIKRPHTEETKQKIKNTKMQNRLLKQKP